MQTEPVARVQQPAVLIVDDSTTNLRLISAMLLEQGIEPRPISGGKLALEVAKANPPDLILLDIDMPEMDGFELCRALKDDAVLKDIPVIFISGMWDTGNVVKGLALGAVDHVSKPFQAEEITARIRTHLRIVSLQGQLREQNQVLEREVSERTRELANANRRLAELARLKDDFLHMIAHELHTPTNGLLGFAELAFEMCPPSEEVNQFRSHYQHSKQRLLNLISDASLIAELAKTAPAPGSLKLLPPILGELRRRVSGVTITIEGEAELADVLVYEEHGLLPRALETVILLAQAFSRRKGEVSFRTIRSPGWVTLRAHLDAVVLPAQTVPTFFEIESMARGSSPAQGLGLAPVVAQRILYALGGDLRLFKEEADNGRMEVALTTEVGDNPFGD